jgi:copper chaperone CopZ
MKKIFRLSGMHCKSCEILLTDKIEDIKDCHVDAISFKK